MYSSDEDVYDGGYSYSYEEYAESLEYEDPGDVEQGYSEGEDDGPVCGCEDEGYGFEYEEYGAEDEEDGAEDEEYRAEDGEYGADDEECGAEFDECGIEDEEDGARDEECGTEEEECGTGEEECGTEEGECGTEGEECGTEEYRTEEEEYETEEEEYREESNSDDRSNDGNVGGDDDSYSSVEYGFGFGFGFPVTVPSVEPHEPTVSDILQVRRYFSLMSVRLPKELIDVILDDASYWAHSSLSLEETASVTSGGKLYLRTFPLAFPNTEGDFVVSGQELHGGSAQSGKLVICGDPSATQSQTRPCRRIEFQLWSGGSLPQDEGSRRASWTWFDACIELPSPLPEGIAVDWPAYLCTGTSSPVQQLPVSFIPRPTEEGQTEPTFSQVQSHDRGFLFGRHRVVTWDYLDAVEQGSPTAQNAEDRGQDWKCLDGSFVKRMQPGDCIALWMRSRHPTVRCTIKKAKITVHWAI